MQLSIKDLSKYIFLISLAIAAFITCTNFSLDPEDSKYLISFILLFPLSFIILTSQNSSDKQNPIKSTLAIIFGCYCLYILSNWYLLGNGYYGLRGICYQWICLLSLILGALFFQKGKNIIIIASVIAASIGAIFAIGEYLAFFSIIGVNVWPPVVTGLFGNRNPFILFLIWSLTWSAYLMILHKRITIKALLAVGMVIQFYALITFHSRGGVILAVITLLLIFVPLLKKSTLFNKSRNRIIAFVVLFLIALIPILSWDDSVWNRFASITSDGSAITRIELYKAELRLIKDKPIFGCGIGNFVYVNTHYWSDNFRNEVSLFRIPRNAESEYFEVLTEQGLVGLAFYIFFVAGAIILAIKGLRREWQWERYIFFVLLIIMLLNGIYDTALRRLPIAILYWSSIGYFWKDHLVSKSSFSLKGFQYALFFSACIHVLITALFIKLLFADHYYLSSIANKNNVTSQSRKLLVKALMYFPDHPDALFRMAFNGAKNGEYEISEISTKRLEEIAPDFKPTNFVRAYAAYNKSQFNSALIYINKELKKNPKYEDAKELKLMILSKLNMCEELRHTQNSLNINTIGCNSARVYYDTVSNTSLQKLYIDQTGKLRTIFGGKKLKSAYIKNLEYSKRTSTLNCEQIYRMVSIKCTDENPVFTPDSTHQ